MLVGNDDAVSELHKIWTM